MFSIEKGQVPENTLLARYSRAAAYTDCYTTEILGCISLADFIYIFYTTFLFKLERFILKGTVSKTSTDAQARQLADGTIESFAAWYVEDRNKNEIMMSDFRQRTRSWLMVEPAHIADSAQTRLYFGSAIVPVQNSRTGEQSLGLVFEALLGFHQVYSMLLLYSAKQNIKNRYLKDQQ